MVEVQMLSRPNLVHLDKMKDVIVYFLFLLIFHEQSLTEVDLFVISRLFQFPHSRVILHFDILSLGRRLNLF